MRRGFSTSVQHAFDLTRAMLERFEESLHRRGITDVALAEAPGEVASFFEQSEAVERVPIDADPPGGQKL